MHTLQGVYFVPPQTICLYTDNFVYGKKIYALAKFMGLKQFAPM
jgi:hypothetical protein